MKTPGTLSFIQLEGRKFNEKLCRLGLLPSSKNFSVERDGREKKSWQRREMKIHQQNKFSVLPDIVRWCWSAMKSNDIQIDSIEI